MPGLRLSHHEGVVGPGQLPEELRLRPRDVDRAVPGKGGVVEVEHLVVERLQTTLGDRDEPYRQIKARQPGRGLEQLRDVLEVATDVGAGANTTNGGDEAHGRVGLGHAGSVPPDRRPWTGSSPGSSTGSTTASQPDKDDPS